MIVVITLKIWTEFKSPVCSQPAVIATAGDQKLPSFQTGTVYFQSAWFWHFFQNVTEFGICTLKCTSSLHLATIHFPFMWMARACWQLSFPSWFSSRGFPGCLNCGTWCLNCWTFTWIKAYTLIYPLPAIWPALDCGGLWLSSLRMWFRAETRTAPFLKVVMTHVLHAVWLE